MKNFEKHIDEITDYLVSCGDRACSRCLFNNNGVCCRTDLVKVWLLSECKEPIKLSPIENALLFNVSLLNSGLYEIENIKDCYIARDGCGCLYIHPAEPCINDDCYTNEIGKYCRFPFDDLFNFVQFGKAYYKISELLEG